MINLRIEQAALVKLLEEKSQMGLLDYSLWSKRVIVPPDKHILQIGFYYTSRKVSELIVEPLIKKIYNEFYITKREELDKSIFKIWSCMICYDIPSEGVFYRP